MLDLESGDCLRPNDPRVPFLRTWLAWHDVVFDTTEEWDRLVHRGRSADERCLATWSAVSSMSAVLAASDAALCANHQPPASVSSVLGTKLHESIVVLSRDGDFRVSWAARACDDLRAPTRTARGLNGAICCQAKTDPQVNAQTFSGSRSVDRLARQGPLVPRMYFDNAAA